MLDPPMFGAEENYSFSSLQVNISPLIDRTLSSLGYSGMSHIDRHDDPLSITVLICISHLLLGTDPGKFYLGETREWCNLHPFSLLLFHGKGPHGGTQAIALGEPDPSEKRINLILYPRREFVNRTTPLLLPCYQQQQLADYSFFADGAASFGNEQYHRSWCGRELFRHLIKANKEYGPCIEDSKLQQAFTAFTGSPKRYIDPESPQGVAITQTIKAANDLMESVRPPWVDSRNAGYKGTEARSAAIRTPELANTPRSTRQTSKQSGSSTAQIQSPAENLPADTRQSTREMPKQSGILNASEKRTDITIEGPRSSARISPSVTQIAVSTSGKTANSRSSTKPRKATKADLKAAVVEAPVLDVDDVPKIETDDDLEYDMESRAPSPSGDTIEEILHGHPLFQLTEMNAQVVATQNKANQLATKFSKRAPQLSLDFHSKTRSKLPDTEGLTIVEQLIQLGELCQWVTQKTEHLWFYRRAMDEQFFLDLLKAEPLFDTPQLVSIFQNEDRNKGAGVCSRSLMDKVVLMVNKMMDKASCGEGAEEEMVFDPVDILRSQHQPKFCSAVKVRLRPYTAKTPYHHMAHHFREVSPPISKTDLDCVSYVLCIVIGNVS
jgi:hypothetical protein